MGALDNFKNHLTDSLSNSEIKNAISETSSNKDTIVSSQTSTVATSFGISIGLALLGTFLVSKKKTL